MYFQGNFKKTIEYLEKASNLGHLQATFQLTTFYDLGSLGVINKDKSIYYYEKAAELDHTESMYKLAYLIDIGDIICADKQKAVYYYKKAANKGHICSIYKYASKLLNGEGTKQDLNEAYRYYMFGNAEVEKMAQFQCGWMINNGYGVKTDINAAQNLFQKISKTKITLQEIVLPNVSSQKLIEICKNFDSIFKDRKNKAMKNFVTVICKFDHYYGQLNADASYSDDILKDADLNSSFDLMLLQKKYGQYIPTDAENARIYYQIASNKAWNPMLMDIIIQFLISAMVFLLI